MIRIEEILAKCKKNDRQAQAALYQWLAPKLLGLCARYFSDRSEAEDIMQDSLVKIYMNLDAYRFEGSFETWAKRITVNTALNRLKENKRMVFDRNAVLAENQDLHNTEVTMLDQKEILACLNELPHGYRTILNLFLFEGFSHREIAEKLDITESTSRSQYSRAREAMARILKERINHKETKLA